MKARYGTTSQGRSAMVKEINRQIIEQEENYFDGLMAIMLWSMHINRGYGAKRLEEVYGEVWETYDEMRGFFETNDTFPAEYKLKEIGVDMEKLRNELKRRMTNEYQN